MRGKYRKSFTNPAAFIPGQPTLIEYTLPDLLYTFKKGHRMMIQVQSSWFPLVDRNPQVFEDIYQAKATDFVPAEIRLYHDRQHTSYIEVGQLDQRNYQRHVFRDPDH